MEQELSNALQANLYLCLFFLGYFFFMRHETLFHRNRAYLVLGALLSVAVPFFEWNAPESVASAVLSDAVMDNVATVIYGAEIAPANSGISWFDGLVLIYLVGVLALSLRFLTALFGIARLVWKHGAKREQGVWVVKLPATWQPFSFFRLLFWSEQPDLGERERQQIWAHELAHIRQWHSIDILFFEILSIVFWLNPVCWLYKQAIRGVHEFLADEAVAGKQSDKTNYSTLLLGQFLSANQCHLSNHFINKHFLKQRIMKLHQSKTGRNAAYKLLIALPVLLTSLFIHACSDKVVEAGNRSKGKPVPTVIDLAKEASGKNTLQYVFILTKGIVDHQFAKSLQNAADIENLSWKFERMALDTDDVLEELGSSNGKKSLFDIKNKQEGTCRYRLTLATKDGTPLTGTLISRATAVSNAEAEAAYTLVKSIPLKDVQEEAIALPGKPGNYLIEVEGTGDLAAQGIHILGKVNGEKKFANVYQGKFFVQISYRCRGEETIDIAIKRDADAANKGVVAIYYREPIEVQTK